MSKPILSLKWQNTYLKFREVLFHEEGEETRYEVRIYHILDGRVLLLRKESAETNCCKDHLEVILVIDELQKLLEVLDLKCQKSFNRLLEKPSSEFE